jgi:hypothetical protein
MFLSPDWRRSVFGVVILPAPSSYRPSAATARSSSFAHTHGICDEIIVAGQRDPDRRRRQTSNNSLRIKRAEIIDESTDRNAGPAAAEEAGRQLIHRSCRLAATP